jgi:uncharacterized phage protein gp47/JayE
MQIITIDETGITKLSQADILQLVKARYLEVFPNLTFENSAPDGFSVNVITELVNDMAEKLISQAFNFDIDTAEGIALDKLANNFGVVRVAGLRTIQDVSITTNKILSLEGGAFKVKDRNQNIFTLSSNAINLSIGTHLLTFQADEVGSINSPLNSINIIETPIDGVVSVNNTTVPTSIGVNYERDDIFRRRIKRSFTINAIGYIDSLIARLLQVDGVTNAIAFQNRTNTTNALGIERWTLACVVEGGQGQDIANVIVGHIVGQNTQGSETVSITLSTGIIEQIEFSRPTNIPLFIKVELTNTGDYTNLDFIKTAIVENLSFDIQATASADRIIQTIRNIPNIKVIIDNVEISIDDITYQNTINTGSFVERFVLDFSKINIIEL